MRSFLRYLHLSRTRTCVSGNVKPCIRAVLVWGCFARYSPFFFTYLIMRSLCAIMLSCCLNVPCRCSGISFTVIFSAFKGCTSKFIATGLRHCVSTKRRRHLWSCVVDWEHLLRTRCQRLRSLNSYKLHPAVPPCQLLAWAVFLHSGQPSIQSAHVRGESISCL